MFVRDRDFERRDIYNYSVDRSEHAMIIRNSTVINTTYIDNSRHTTYVTGPAREDVQRVTGRRINPVTIQESNRPGRDQNDGQLRMYRPEVVKNVRADRNPAPRRIENLENIKRPSERKVSPQPRNNSGNNNDIRERQSRDVSPAINNERQQQNNNTRQRDINRSQPSQQPQQAVPAGNNERQQQNNTRQQNINRSQPSQQPQQAAPAGNNERQQQNNTRQQNIKRSQPSQQPQQAVPAGNSERQQQNNTRQQNINRSQPSQQPQQAAPAGNNERQQQNKARPQNNNTQPQPSQQPQKAAPTRNNERQQQQKIVKPKGKSADEDKKQND